MTQKKKNKLASFVKVIVPLGIGLYLLWFFYASMDEATKTVFYRAIREANYFWIGLSVLLGILSHALRAYRWKYMLEPLGYSPRFSHRFYTVMSGYLINLLLPRAGEASRAALLYRSDKVPFSKSFGTIIAERVFDSLTLGFILLFTLFLSLEDLLSIKEQIISGAGSGEESSSHLWLKMGFITLIVLGITSFLYLWKKKEGFKEKIIEFITGLLNGVLAVFKTKKPIQFVVQTLLIWLLYLLYFAVCFYAFEETKSFPLHGILIGFIAGTFGIAFTNGGIGAYPYLVGIVVTFFIGGQFADSAEAEGIGKALGMIIWSSQTIMMIVLGLISLILIPKKYNKEEEYDKMGAHSTEDSNA